MWQSQSYPIMNHQPSHSPTIWIHLGDSYGLKTDAPTAIPAPWVCLKCGNRPGRRAPAGNGRSCEVVMVVGWKVLEMFNGLRRFPENGATPSHHGCLNTIDGLV